MMLVDHQCTKCKAIREGWRGIALYCKECDNEEPMQPIFSPPKGGRWRWKDQCQDTPD
jgi:hypothetical protein